MKNKRQVSLLALLLSVCVLINVVEISTLCVSAKKSIGVQYRSILIGSWQYGSPEVGAGFNDFYEFSTKGWFVFKFSQYDGEKRILSLTGQWSIIHDNLLMLKITEKTMIKGGEFIKENTSETTDYVLRNGKTVRTKIIPAEEVIYPLRLVKKSKDGESVISIGGRKFWKMSRDN